MKPEKSAKSAGVPGLCIMMILEAANDSGKHGK
jgi:hypothetical protein